MSEEFKVLDDRTHLLSRPGMYIGSTSPEPFTGIINFEYQTKQVVPGLLKIINEVIDNSVDEFIRTNGKHANKIDIVIEDSLEGTAVVVTDNGRGIPVKEIGDSYQPVLAWTKARAGSNFSADDSRITLGMNGVGAFATNCFSKSFVGTSNDGKQKIVVTCSDNCSEIKHKITKGTPATGTEVRFIPDLQRFNLPEFTQDHIDVLYDRIQNLAVCYPGIQFSFNDEKIKFKNIKAVAKYFSEDAVTLESDKGSFIFAPSGADEEFRCLSYVNGLHIKNGGSHIDYILECIINHLRPAIKRKWKIEVLPNQIKQHILVASWMVNFPNMKFDSQTKERITNTRTEVAAFLEFFEDESERIAKKIIDTETIIGPMVEAILHKKELAERRAAAAAMKKVQKKKIANHLTASSQKWEEKQLFIAEGLSAIGGLLNVRDPKIHGGYALRGKIMNTHGMKPVDIVKNKELSELLSVIGLDLDNPDYDELNYGKICCLTDQDFDGSGIFCLLLQFFSRWPKLFQEGRICRVISPLYIAKKKGKEDRLYYTHDDFANENQSLLFGYEVSYNKGLGSLSEDIYEKMIKQPVTIDIKELTNDDVMKLEMSFGNDANLRKEWMLSI